ncbi:hypothetical protein [Streptomyces sp. NPDC090994]|uniref:hypothetical protein n=1 Tax=Streptomyces sp. NPDC090994 TaxID=3365969 RepID=UPI0037F749DF
MDRVEDRTGVGPPEPDLERNAAVSVADQVTKGGSGRVDVALLENVQGRAGGECGGRGPPRSEASRTGLLDRVEGPPFLGQRLLVQCQDLRWDEARQPAGVGDPAKQDAGQRPKVPEQRKTGLGVVLVTPKPTCPLEIAFSMRFWATITDP